MSVSIKSILGTLSHRPAASIQKVLDWTLGRAEKHWGAEAKKHQEAAIRNKGTTLEAKAEAAYSESFNNWHACVQMRRGIAKVRLLGGEMMVTSQAA